MLNLPEQLIHNFKCGSDSVKPLQYLCNLLESPFLISVTYKENPRKTRKTQEKMD